MDVLYPYIMEMVENAKWPEKPNDKNNNNNNVEDGFNFSVHWNEAVNNPQQNTRNNQYNKNSK